MSAKKTHVNFGGDRLSGHDGQIPHLYHKRLSFSTSLFFDSIKQATADTAEPILTRDGSYDVSPLTVGAFWGSR